MTLAGLLTAGSLSFGVGASADTAAEYDTKANIHFIESEDITKPVDPDNPGTEVTPEVDEDGKDPIEPGTKGPLSIDYASHINFGEVTKSGNAQTYFAKPIQLGDGEERAPYVQVTDNRGTKAGWELQVKQATPFTNGEATLDGAVLSLKNGEVNSNSNTDFVTPTDITFDNHGELYPVMTAAEDHGAGTFTNQFGKITDGQATDVSLTVPADLKIDEGKYSTDINWVLVDTP